MKGGQKKAEKEKKLFPLSMYSKRLKCLEFFICLPIFRFSAFLVENEKEKVMIDHIKFRFTPFNIFKRAKNLYYNQEYRILLLRRQCVRKRIKK